MFADQIQKGTHITAVGADTAEKQEVDASVFSIADVVAVDSISQCTLRGDTSHAIKARAISTEQLVELGQLITENNLGRTNDEQITLTDLTGLAIQDLQIATLVAIQSHII